MKYFNSLVIGVNTVSIGKDMKVPSAYKGDLKFEKRKKLVFNTRPEHSISKGSSRISPLL